MSISDVSDAPHRDVDKLSQLSRQTSHDGSSTHPDGFVSPKEVEEQAPLYEHSSQITKEWLKSYEHFKQDTNVSLRFQIDAENYSDTAPHTLVPLLTKWLRVWFDRSLKEQQDRTNLVWLLQFTADYLKLNHAHLDNEEILNLCTTLLYICGEARQHSHLEGCLSVFLAITEIHYFPRKCLRQTVQILCTAVIILEKPLRRIDLCIKLLAKGDLHDATVESLHNLLLQPSNAKTESKEREENDLNVYLTPARGSARYLTILTNEDTNDEKPVLNLEETLRVLKEASDIGVLRFATEILAFLGNAVRSKRGPELFAQPQSVALLFQVFTACKGSVIIPDTGEGGKSKTSREEAQNRGRRYRRDHASAVRGFQEALARSLPEMPKDTAQIAWEAIRGSLDELGAASRENALRYVGTHQLCLPENSADWAQNLFILLDKVVIGKFSLSDAQIEEQLQEEDDPDSTQLREKIRQRASQRIDVIRLCAGAIASAALQNSQEEVDYAAIEPSSLDFGIKALRKMLQLTHTERKLEVITILFEQLLNLCNIATALHHPYANIIIEVLEKQILTNARNDHPHGDNFIGATECIRSIFLQALERSPVVANQAFQSLLRIANCQTCNSSKCRLIAMCLLFRIRSGTSGKVYIDNTDDSAYIAGALLRTQESVDEMQANIENGDDHTSRSGSVTTQPLWMYPREGDIVSEWAVPDQITVHIRGARDTHVNSDLHMADWLWTITTNLQYDNDWDTYSYAIVHLGCQFMNMKLFEYSLDLLAGLRGFLCGRVRERKLMFEPPKELGLDKSDVALCFYHILTRLIPYYKLQPFNPHIHDPGRKGIELVRAFRTGITGDTYYGTARQCIHALAICCYETPEAIGSEYPGIIEAMAKTVSTPHVVSHILEFLAQVARLPNLHRHFMEEEVRGIFGICIAALKSLMSRDEPKGPPSIDSKRVSGHPNVTSHRNVQHTPFRSAMLKEKGLKQYSCALAYHTMIFWFLSIPIGQRQKYVKEITKQLTWIDTKGNATLDEQTVVLIDLMQRTAFSDLPETARDESFTGDEYETTSFVMGNSVVTIEAHKITGRSQVTKRQAAGTTHAIYEPRIQPLPAHHDQAFYVELERRGFSDKVQPPHILLNMIGSAVPIDLTEQPLKLNSSEAYVGRAIRAIDYISTVDSHKVAMTLLKPGQTEESAYLANISGTKSFDTFLDSIGTRVSLEPPCPFTPFGLLHETDGTETVAWRDRINEVVFEISTFMPNVENDEYQARKKSHLGNCLVLVVFNQSHKEWKWENFKSQATLVNIVITPTNRVAGDSDDVEHEFFEVRVWTKEEYQNISAAAETKVVSRATLAPFVRMLALNANIFSECARNELTGDNEFPSSWRYRMKEIQKLRATTLERSVDEDDGLAKRYDFSRWT